MDETTVTTVTEIEAEETTQQTVVLSDEQFNELKNGMRSINQNAFTFTTLFAVAVVSFVVCKVIYMILKPALIDV